MEHCLDYGILWVCPEGNAFDHAEGSQDQGKVAWDLEWVRLGELFHLHCHLQQSPLKACKYDQSSCMTVPCR